MKKTLKLLLLSNFVVLVMAVSGLKAQDNIRVYGFSSLFFEKVGPLSNAPSGDNGDPAAFDFANLNLMFQANVSEKVRAFVNLRGTDQFDIQNYWGEYIVSDQLKFRSGKIYRRFGQFNELLDAVPTYLGFEPPEIYDGDHLLIPRTGVFMVHGGTGMGDNYLNYSYMLDGDDNLLASDGDGNSTLSHTFDVNANILDYRLTVGASAFFANNESGPAVGVGEGAPRGGTLGWMDTDTYNAFSAYFSGRFDRWTIKGAYFYSNHDAQRNPEAVSFIAQNTNLNANQIENFFGANYNGTFAPADVVRDANYDITAWYLRFGYTIPKSKVPTSFAEVTPYLLLDGYQNPETIADKAFGGDGEAGIADDGRFFKPTFGFAFRFTPAVVLKIDASSHFQEINGSTEYYNEFRMDLSFQF